jgi:hypothetical protein
MSDSFQSRFDVDFDGEIPDSVDESALRRMETVAAALDESIEIPGTGYSIGLDPILGSLPVAGDVASGAISLYIIAEAAYLGVSYSTVLRMLVNVAVDTLGGVIPVAGGIFDAVWKANKKNVELALQDLAEPLIGSESDETSDQVIDIPVQDDD